MKVLIVDDEKLICQSIASKIGRLHHTCTYETQWATSVREALDLYAQSPFDVVITDINMPGADGFTLIRKIRALGGSPHIFVVSGYDQFEYVRKAFLLDVDDYLLKPVAQSELDEKLRAISAVPDESMPLVPSDGNGDKPIALIIHTVLDMIHADDSYKLTLKEIAYQLQVSYTHLSSLFSEQMGCGFSAYQIKRRMEKARLLLQDPSLHVAEVAQKLGYSEASLLSRDYKRYYGVSLREFREQNTKGTRRDRSGSV